MAGMTSAGGRSHTFDERADGYARAEACCASGLLRASDGDAAGASVLRGSCVRQDGKSASLTAPNGQAQQALLVASLSDASLSAEDLSCAEAHGTGTALGDPIEARSLAVAVLAERRCSSVPALHGDKANSGHGEPTAGLVGLVALAVSLMRQSAPPNAQLRVLNPHVGAATRDVSCVLPAQLSLASSGAAGGVSSFGYGGTIAHALLSPSTGGQLTLCPAGPLVYRRSRYRWLSGPSDDSPASGSPPSASLPPACVSVGLDEVGVLAQAVIGQQVGPDTPLMQGGLDSLGAVELRNRLQHAVGTAMTIPSTIIFDAPTTRQLAAVCAGGGGDALSACFVAEPGVRSALSARLAGVSAALPGRAASAAAVWLMMRCGQDVVDEVPASRWAQPAENIGELAAARIRHGGFIAGAQRFDARAFGVPAAEAGAMDPQQRLVLERGYEALHGAGLVGTIAHTRVTAVCLGIQAMDFLLLGQGSAGTESVYSATGFQHAIAAGRLSYVLGGAGRVARGGARAPRRRVRSGGVVRRQSDACT